MQDQPVVKKERRTTLTIATEWVLKLTRPEKQALADALAKLIEHDKQKEREALQKQLDALK